MLPALTGCRGAPFAEDSSACWLVAIWLLERQSSKAGGVGCCRDEEASTGASLGVIRADSRLLTAVGTLASAGAGGSSAAQAESSDAKPAADAKPSGMISAHHTCCHQWVKVAEDDGRGQLCYLRDLYRHRQPLPWLGAGRRCSRRLLHGHPHPATCCLPSAAWPLAHRSSLHEQRLELLRLAAGRCAVRCCLAGRRHPRRQSERAASVWKPPPAGQAASPDLSAAAGCLPGALLLLGRPPWPSSARGPAGRLG